MTYRLLTDQELYLLNNSPCARIAQQARLLQNNATEQLKQYTCNGLTFIDVWRPQERRRYVSVSNHPGMLTATGLAAPSKEKHMNTRTHLRGVPHWLGAGHPDLGSGTNDDIGIGTYAALPNPQNRAEISAAIDFLAYYDANGCSRSSLPVVTALQNAYNASGLPGKLTLEGEYGPNSQRALQNIMDEAQADAGAGPSQQAPANCFPEYGQVPSIPALDVTPTATPTATPSGTYTAPVTTVTGGAPTSNAAILLIGGAAAATAGGLGYWYWKKHKRGR